MRTCVRLFFVLVKKKKQKKLSPTGPCRPSADGPVFLGRLDIAPCNHDPILSPAPHAMSFVHELLGATWVWWFFVGRAWVVLRGLLLASSAVAQDSDTQCE